MPQNNRAVGKEKKKSCEGNEKYIIYISTSAHTWNFATINKSQRVILEHLRKRDSGSQVKLGRDVILTDPNPSQTTY